MNFVRLLITAGVYGAAVVSSTPSQAALKLCNQTSYIVYAATASATKTMLDTRGWSRIVPGDCATPTPDPLTAPAYFVYARTSQAHSGPTRAWGGGVPICARDSNFAQHTKLPVQGCSSVEFYKMPFAVVDRHGRSDWTTTFTESPNINTPSVAKHAGINRLLTDLGYHVNVPGERAPDLALEDFHKRTKLPADANEAELFAALETAAMRAAAPAGYTICNQTDKPLWAAIGLQVQKTVSTRGWWQIAARACSRLITEPLRTERVYLLAKHANGQPLVSGPMNLCVSGGEFERTGKGPCTDKGVAQRGFAITDTKGRSGYVARIAESGLLPQTGKTK